MKMSHRFFISAGTLAILIASLSAAIVPITGQAQTSGAATWTPPKEHIARLAHPGTTRTCRVFGTIRAGFPCNALLNSKTSRP